MLLEFARQGTHARSDVDFAAWRSTAAANQKPGDLTAHVPPQHASASMRRVTCHAPWACMHPRPTLPSWWISGENADARVVHPNDGRSNAERS